MAREPFNSVIAVQHCPGKWSLWSKPVFRIGNNAPTDVRKQAKGIPELSDVPDRKPAAMKVDKGWLPALIEMGFEQE